MPSDDRTRVAVMSALVTALSVSTLVAHRALNPDVESDFLTSLTTLCAVVWVSITSSCAMGNRI
jgi:hypothetical protein